MENPTTIAALALVFELGLLVGLIIMNRGPERRSSPGDYSPRRSPISEDVTNIIHTCGRIEGQIDTIGRVFEARNRGGQWTRTRF